LELTLWSCWERVQLLRRFSYLCRDYFDYNERNATNLSLSDLKEDHEHIRKSINRILPRAARFLRESGQYPVLTVREAPSVGGGIWNNIDALSNIFHLDNFEIPEDMILDAIDRGIGYYYDEMPTSFLRTINPFWWVWRLARVVISFPFRIIEWAGYDGSSAEQSSQGKLYKALVGITVFFAGIVGFLAGIAQIIDVLGLSENLQKWLNIGITPFK
jgi:hypothetical protein